MILKKSYINVKVANVIFDFFKILNSQGKKIKCNNGFRILAQKLYKI